MGVFVLIGICGIAVIFLGAKLHQLRAERLHSKLVLFRVGVSTFDEARSLANDYKHNLELQSKDCTTVDCRFVIRLTNFRFPVFYDAPLFWKVGLRPAGVVATVSVRNGTVSYADFGVFYRTQHGYWLESSFHAANELTMYDRCGENLGRNSQYAVTGGFITNGDGGGQFVQVAFGKAVSDEQRARATDVRLGCITAVPGCKTLNDLMPRVWEGQLYESDLDESFNAECERYMQEQEQKQGGFPWHLDSAFHPTPVTVNSWTLNRPHR